jgi:fructoselysine-6-P-deglycase FrlB-like protein
MNIGVDVIPTKGDWAFGISHRGTSKPTEAALDFCLRVGAFTVLVAGEDARKMESAQLTLTTVPQERVEPHTASMTGAICAITSLMMGLKGLEEWDALRSIGDPDLDQLRQKVGEGPSVLLGEFEGEWLAREGALKLMEMARLPVRVFGSEEFYHGPKFSHNFEKDSIWHILTPQDPRNDEIKPSYRITVTGMTPLAWIPALIQLQWMSLAVALNRGVNPDDPNL